MLTNSENWGPDLPVLCRQILQGVITEEDKYQVGLTKIFFRAGMLAHLERVRSNRLRSLVVLMQKNFLRTFYQRKYASLRVATVGIQSQFRKVLAKKRAEQTKKDNAAIILQRHVRGHLQRKQYLHTRSAVVSIQSGKAAISSEKQRRMSDVICCQWLVAS